jgi:hypothetical protein
MGMIRIRMLCGMHTGTSEGRLREPEGSLVRTSTGACSGDCCHLFRRLHVPVVAPLGGNVERFDCDVVDVGVDVSVDGVLAGAVENVVYKFCIQNTTIQQ